MTKSDCHTPSKIIDAVVLARGGSKGIPKKNVRPFVGKPLIEWTIDWCKSSSYVRDVYVSSDDDQILQIAKKSDCKLIKRPAELSGDKATSESAWTHATEIITNQDSPPHAIIAPQVTSPVRLPEHLEQAINKFFCHNLDSLFSASLAGDLCLWTEKDNEVLSPLNFDPQNRGRRQDREPQFIENGSFYIFTPTSLLTKQNRFGDRLGYSLMPRWSNCEIDEPEDWATCEHLFRTHILETN